MTIPLEAISSPAIVQDDGDVYIEVYCNKNFTASSNRGVIRGDLNTGNYCIRALCTNVAKVVGIPLLNIEPTEDGIDDQTAQYSAFLRQDNQQPVPYLLNFTVPPLNTGQTSTSWPRLRLHKAAVKTLPDNQTYNKTQVGQLIDLVAGEFLKAGVATYGIARSSVSPLNSGDPVFLGDNDPRANVFVNVKSNGVVGDGITVDLVAFQNSINAAEALGGGCVYVPPTTTFYNFGSGSSGLTVPGNVFLYFAEGRSAQVRWGGTGFGIAFGGASGSFYQGCGIYNLDMILTSNTAKGVTNKGTNQFFGRNIYIEGVPTTSQSDAWFVDGGNAGNLFTMLVNFNAAHVKRSLVLGTTGSQVTTTFRGLGIYSFNDLIAGSVGIDVANGTIDTLIWGGNAEQSASAIKHAGQKLVLYGYRWESDSTLNVTQTATGTGLLLDGCSDVDATKHVNSGGSKIVISNCTDSAGMAVDNNLENTQVRTIAAGAPNPDSSTFGAYILNQLRLDDGVTPFDFQVTGSTLRIKNSTGDVLLTLGWGNGNLSVIGSLLNKRAVTAKTANYPVVTADTNTFFTNAGASGEVDFTLPTPVVGMTYEFYVNAAQIVKIIPANPATQTIRVGASVTTAGAGGLVSANTVGNRIRLVAISTTQWVGDVTGTWTFV